MLFLGVLLIPATTHCLVHKGKKPFKCSSSEYQATKKSHLNAHIASVHEDEKKIQMQYL